MHLLIADEVHVLEAGDSIVFDCSMPHRVENHGRERLIQVSAITPPRY
jgi:mannose-6-phosphate isomerase-like protein (cupin superfamily)